MSMTESIKASPRALDVPRELTSYDMLNELSMTLYRIDRVAAQLVAASNGETVAIREHWMPPALIDNVRSLAERAGHIEALLGTVQRTLGAPESEVPHTAESEVAAYR